MTNSVINLASPRIGFNWYLFKQAAATFASCLLSLTGGFTFGHTAVLLPKLQMDDNYPYDKGYDSWIASISPLAMMCGCLFAGPMSDAIGRRKGQMLLVFPYTLGWIIMGIATDNTTMLVGRFVTGICTGAIRPLGMVYIGEVSDPKYRATTLFCPAVAVYVGCLICHLLGNYLPWRLVCFIFTIPSLLCFATLLVLKESPLWMIAKGNTEQGVETFKWYRGEGELAGKELKSVLDSQDKVKMSSYKQFSGLVFTKTFLTSIMSMFFVFVAVQMCGINTITFYAADMFKSTFGGQVDPFILMIVTDVIRVIFTVVICLLAKKLPRKNTFLISSFATSLLLTGLVIYLYMKPDGLVWLAVTCLIAYIAFATALTSISWSFVAEIFPSKVRGFGSGVSSLLSFSLLFISVKVTPSIMLNFGDAAMYASFAVFTLIAGSVLSFILPETNGKSLQDIENTLYSKNKNIEMSQKYNTVETKA